jgi:hypothetical protein
MLPVIEDAPMTVTDPFDWELLRNLIVPQLPLLLIWLVGLVVAIVNLKRHPRIAALFMIAMALLIADEVGGSLVMYFLINRAWTTGFVDYQTYQLVLRLVISSLQVVAWILVIVAVFSGRQQFRRFDPHEEHLPVKSN